MSFFLQRDNMIKNQLLTQGICSAILQLFANANREHFIAPKYCAFTYAEYSIPLYNNQVTENCVLIAKILQALNIQTSHTVLEIGTGSGFMTYLLSLLAHNVISYEIDPVIYKLSQEKLSDISNVCLENLDGYYGSLNANEKFDIILTTGSYYQLPKELLTQLKVGGKIFAILKEEPVMQATIIKREQHNKWSSVPLFETMAPKLINAKARNLFNF